MSYCGGHISQIFLKKPHFIHPFFKNLFYSFFFLWSFILLPSRRSRDPPSAHHDFVASDHREPPRTPTFIDNEPPYTPAMYVKIAPFLFIFLNLYPWLWIGTKIFFFFFFLNDKKKVYFLRVFFILNPRFRFDFPYLQKKKWKFWFLVIWKLNRFLLFWFVSYFFYFYSLKEKKSRFGLDRPHFLKRKYFDFLFFS